MQITHPERLKIRHKVLENLNTLRPGDLYNEKEVNTTYTRFASVGMLSGVNVNLEPVSDDQVDCNITLRNSRLQAFRADLEASVNSTGLVGISPQLNYIHKNIFHGGEQLNIGVKGNFQFKPRDPAYSTEVSVTGSIRFPKFIGLPNRIFKGPNIPRTDITMGFVYQDRPEYRRAVISTQTNPFLLSAYMDHFDMGVGGMLYYTTDASAVPKTPFHYVRFGFDLSGNLLSLFNPLMPVNEYDEHTIWSTPYSQYVRGELNLGKVFRFGKNDQQAVALHLMAGAGYAYGNSDNMPVEKLFYSGGSMSMRGWQARTLGPGTSQPMTMFSIPSQVGQMKLEANVEYRFPLVWKLEGALFADAGNIWDFPPLWNDYTDDGSYFSFKTFPESLGLDWGLGIRLNLDFILIRVDAGVRLHDPVREEGNRWVPINQWFKGNYAIHFGVGYPF